MTPDLIILYVKDVHSSAAFYKEIFNTAHGDISDSFTMFMLPSGVMVGLWKIEDVAPAVPGAATPGSMEIGIPVPTDGEVDTVAQSWEANGVEIIQQPVNAPFGRTFTAADPDGHRLRVYSPANR